MARLVTGPPSNTSDPEEVWKRFWRPLVAPQGQLDETLLKRMLFAAWKMAMDTERTYDRMTEGVYADPAASAEVIADEARRTLSIEEHVCCGDIECPWAEMLHEGCGDSDPICPNCSRTRYCPNCDGERLQDSIDEDALMALVKARVKRNSERAKRLEDMVSLLKDS